MIDAAFSADRDPRLAAPFSDLDLASVRAAPQVGRAPSAAEGLGLAVGLIGAAALGGFTILGLAHHHAAAQSAPKAVAAAAPAQAAASPPPAAPAALTAKPTPASATPPAALSAPPPILVVDTSLQPATASPPSLAREGDKPGAAPAKSDILFTQDEQFAAHAGGDAAPVSHVQRLEHPSQMIAQGSVIPAVLETALDSDLPGYARALVSRDVKSFDSSQVLIPRGSRLVGQYKSALETGQSRMLIIWTRLLRPDGVTIQLGSPSTDDLGEAGLAGKVDRHLLQRYGSAVLLTVVGGLTSLAGSTNTLVIGTATQGSSAASVALQDDGKISPTVKIMQGAPIQVFVARDLDFSEDTP